MAKRSELDLEGLGLQGRQTLMVDVEGEDSGVLVEVLLPEMLEIWRTARRAVSGTGRWPILVASQFPWLGWREGFTRGNPVSRRPFGGLPPSEVLHRAAAMQPELNRRIDQKMRIGPVDRVEHMERGIRNARLETEHVCAGAAPSAGELTELYLREGEFALQRRLFEWELAHECEVPLDYQEWFEPDGPVALLFLPTSEPWATYAYVDALFEIDQALLVCAAKRWNERYGAEPVAAWGTMTQLFVARPPRDPEEALRLAVEHTILGPSTLPPPGIPLRWHARALLVLDRWFLHARP